MSDDLIARIDRSFHSTWTHTKDDLLTEAKYRLGKDAATIARLETENVRMREALKPFADYIDQWGDENATDDMSIERALYEYQQPTIGDLRRARAALAPVGDDAQ